MEPYIAPAIVLTIFGGCLIGFFRTKTPGFGKYTTALLILMLVTFVGAFALSIGRIEWPSLANLLFAIAGFAGGLVTPKDD